MSLRMVLLPYFVYILTNETYSIFYVGITKNLKREVYEHKQRLVTGHARKYNLSRLVYFEDFTDLEQAKIREKEIKDESRLGKRSIIRSMNPEGRDLYEDIFF